MNYIMRNEIGISIVKEKEDIKEKGLKQFINELCLKNLCTFDGRVTAIRTKVKLKSLIPVYINRNFILFPTKPLRDYGCVFVNYHNVLSVGSGNEGKSKIIFYDLTELEIDVSIRKLHKQLDKCRKILAYKLN